MAQAVAVFVTDAQMMGTLAKFELLKDEEVENLCEVAQRLGGTVVNPVAGQPGQAPTLPDPGVAVSLRAENNLKLACCFLRHRTRVSRAVAPIAITMNSARALRTLKDWEEEHENVEAPELNPKDWPRVIENVKEWLRGCLGVTKIPLACVIRNAIDPTPEANDPAANCDSKQDELIARAPVRTVVGGVITCDPVCLSDRAMVQSCDKLN